MKPTPDQRHGPVRTLSPAEIAEYEASAQGQRTAALAARAAAEYGGRVQPYRVIITADDRSQRNVIIMARSITNAEDIARERYPDAAGIDAWKSTNNGSTK